MNRYSSLTGRSLHEEGGRFFQDLDRLLVFAVLLAQPPQFLALGTGQLAALAPAPVGLGLAVPAAQGLPADVEFPNAAVTTTSGPAPRPCSPRWKSPGGGQVGDVADPFWVPGSV
jgi:hypothetical protein